MCCARQLFGLALCVAVLVALLVAERWWWALGLALLCSALELYRWMRRRARPRQGTHRDRVELRNDAEGELRFVLEPIGMVYTLAPGSTVVVEATGEAPGRIEVIRDGASTIAYPWPSSVAHLFIDGKHVDDTVGLAVPPLPEGTSVRDFIEGFLGGHA